MTLRRDIWRYRPSFSWLTLRRGKGDPYPLDLLFPAVGEVAAGVLDLVVVALLPVRRR
jgi:hypothetical protein